MKAASIQLAIGPVRFVFKGAAASGVRYTDWAYRDFFTNGRGGETDQVQLTLPIHLMKDAPSACPEREPDFAAGRNWALWDEGSVMKIYSGFTGRERPRVACELDTDLTGCRLHVDGDVHDAPLRYPLDQVLTWGLLGHCQGVLLHAAVVVREGKGYVLAGRSGAGKSTLSGLCRHAGWEVLNDDRVILHRDVQKGQWLVSGTPWHGSGCFAKHRTVPLQGIYVLEQAMQNRAVLLPEREGRMVLLDVAAVAWFSEAWSQAALDTLGRLCHDVPVSRFAFTRSVDALSFLGWEVAA